MEKGRGSGVMLHLLQRGVSLCQQLIRAVWMDSVGSGNESGLRVCVQLCFGHVSLC